ncbi:MAG: SdrD B-like domain-containing protein [Patescibacteria group bacterium]
MNANHYNYNPKKRGKFYRVVNIIVMTAFLFNMSATQGLLMLSPAQATQPVDVGVDKYTICHATESTSNPWTRNNVAEPSLSAHLDEHGTPLAGHEGDVLLGIDNEDVLQCPTVVPPVCSEVFADYDLNGDCVVNLSDVAMYATAYANGEVFDTATDYNEDGIVWDLSDVSWFAEHKSIDPSADLNNDGQSNEGDITCFSAMVGATDPECNIDVICTDTDGDEICDEVDNCPLVANPDQTDTDNDGVGDVCDNCVNTPNPDQADDDGDHAGNACDAYYCVPTNDSVEICDDLDNNCDGYDDEGDVCQEQSCVEGPTWAYELIANDQGTQYGGGNIDANRSDPMQALGEADSVDGQLGDFYSLGMNGWITLKFQYPVMDVDGDDLSFHEETWGSRTTYGIEKAQVAVSKDNITWENIGEINNQTADGIDYLDFSSTGWDFIRYVRLTDTTDFAAEFPGNGTADGYDLDAVDATNGVCEEIPDPVTYDIHGQKWNDEDNDGIWDDNEDPLAGVEITLDGGNAGTVFTNANGEYEFSDLLPNSYTICEVVQDGWEQTLPGTGSGDCYEVTLPDGGDTTYNFGNHRIDNVTIVAYKIVCTEESDLPNWGNGGENITAATAQNWVDAHESCELVADWNFQYRIDGGDPYNPGDNTGVAGGDWHTFGPTVNGTTSVDLDLDLADKFWFREVMQPGYIPFTYNVVGNNSNNVSAEFYCNNDVLNYDNLEWIDNMTPGETYHCVAWNVLDEEPTYDLHGYKWDDQNGDGYDCTPNDSLSTLNSAENCEPKLSGWTINLYEGDSTEPLDTMITSSLTEHFGWYWFENLPAGDYRICEELQTGWNQTYPGEDGCHYVTLPTLPTDKAAFSLNAVFAPEYNFGNTHDTGDLSIIKLDDNGNRMPNVAFQIDGENYQTNEEGMFTDNLLTGYHVVQEMGTEGYTFTSVSGENCTNSNPSAALVNKNSVTTCTFTNTRDTGELTGLKYEDLNGNGMRDCPDADKISLINGPVDDPECEPVLQGWTINISLNTCSEDSSDYDLSGDENLNLSDIAMMAQYLETPNDPQGDLNADSLTNQADFNCFSTMYNDQSLPSEPDMSDVTDEYGNYEFTGLIPGSYDVCEVQQDGWQQTEPGDNTNPNNEDCYTLLVSPGDEISYVDFGNTYVGYCGDRILQEDELCDGTLGEISDNFTCVMDGPQQCQTVVEDPHSTITGYKYEDLNGNHEWSPGEMPLNNWEICRTFTSGEGPTINSNLRIAIDILPFEVLPSETSCVLTGTGEWLDGYYEFKFYGPGHATVTETMQPGYTKTQPIEAGYEVEMTEPIVYGDYNFGNQPDFGVTITKTADKTTVGALEQFNYSVNWTLSGLVTADNVVITDTLPAKVTFVSATNGGVYDAATHTITWSATNVAPGTGSYGVTVQTTAGVSNTEELINNVKILATESLTPAEVSALALAPGVISIERSATASAKVTVSVTPAATNPLLQITKDASEATADAGDTVTYTVVVTNVGSATATNVMVDDTLPAGMTFVEGGGTTVALVLGDIAIGQSKTTTYDVKVADTATTGSYENLAEAHADNHAKISDSAIVNVEAPIVLGDTTEAELALIKTADVEFTNPGGMVEYTLTITNNGTEDAQNVVLTDQLPEWFVFEGTTDAVKLWEFATIAVGSAETVTYKVSVDAAATAGMYDNVALATADNSENAGASATVEVRAVSVLGALVETGSTLRDYILYFAGIMLVVSGIFFSTRERKLQQTK